MRLGPALGTGFGVILRGDVGAWEGLGGAAL